MKLIKNTWKNKALLLMALPAVILIIMFNYVPMAGLVLAFKRFNFQQGIFKSPWVGLNNFKFLFTVGDTAWVLTRNTVAYYFVFLITGTVGEVLLAIGINEMVFKKAAKYCQSSMILPSFIPYIAVSFVVYAFLKSETGIVNRLLISMGKENYSFYIKPDYWPLILTVVKIWKRIGYGSVLYLSVLTGIDPALYESAALDGANARQKMWYITLPMLVPMIVIMTLLSLGNIMESDTGLFFQVTKNVGALYPATQVWDSYVLNAIAGSTEYGLTAAATFFQSIVGFIMVVATNLIVRRFAPDKALF